MDPEQLKKLQEESNALEKEISDFQKKIGRGKATKAQREKLLVLQARRNTALEKQQKALNEFFGADDEADAETVEENTGAAPYSDAARKYLEQAGVDLPEKPEPSFKDRLASSPKNNLTGPDLEDIQKIIADARNARTVTSQDTPKPAPSEVVGPMGAAMSIPAGLASGELELGSEVGPTTRTESNLLDPDGNPVLSSSGEPMKTVSYENPTRSTVVKSTPGLGAAIAKGLLERKQKQSDLRKEFGKALQTGLENLSGDALKANMSGLREAMVSQGLVSAEQFNRTGRRMMKNLEAQRFKDSLTDPARSAVTKTPGLDRQEAMQGRAFGTSTALEGSVGGLGDANRSLESEKGRLNRAARALKRAGNKKEAGEARAAAEAMGRPGIRTQAARAAEKAAREQQEKLEEEKRKQIAAMVQEGKDRSQKTVNKNATPGAGRGTRI